MTYITDDFLLKTEQARTLYHEYAAGMPIVDYHCHLPPEEVAQDKRWENLTQVWLYGDHYKWRTMRSNGIDEEYCTGDATDREKFDKFAGTMPYLLRNPMHHWSHLELLRYFGVDEVLSPATADTIWEQTQERFQDPEFSARGLMRQSNVKLVCTTDDPTDSLEHHQSVAADADFDVLMRPTWRPDKALTIDRPELWNAWLDKLAASADTEVGSFDEMMAALRKRHQHFSECSCKLSDYGLETVYAADYTDAEVNAVFAKARAGQVLSGDDLLKYRSRVLFECMQMDVASDWTIQIHYGAMRNNNTRMFEAIGADTGFDSIGDWPVAEAMTRLLDRLEYSSGISRVILYTLNPRDNEVLAAMLGNFQGGGVPGRIQLGSGWWFNDQMDGMKRQMEALSQMGLLSRFVGMLTDSRSFLSYTRHEYFRRILCNILGQDMADGLIPADMAWTGEVVKAISYNNAASYFGFGLPQC